MERGHFLSVVKTNTIFEDSRVPLKKWFIIIGKKKSYGDIELEIDEKYVTAGCKGKKKIECQNIGEED